MAYSFGQDSGFDWGSLIGQVVQTGGQVAASVLGKNQTATTQLPTQYTNQPITTTTGGGMGTSTMLLLGVAAVLGVVLVMKISKRRG